MRLFTTNKTLKQLVIKCSVEGMIDTEPSAVVNKSFVVRNRSVGGGGMLTKSDRKIESNFKKLVAKISRLSCYIRRDGTG